jgi:autotransporter-associated beta strand protein
VRKFLLAGVPIAAAIAIFFLIPRDATWKADPGDGIYDNASNWSSGSVPDGTAFFDASSRSDLTFRRGYIARYVRPNDLLLSNEGWISVGGWTFNPGAANYQFKIGPAEYPINETIRVPCTGERLRFTGAGIAVNGGSVSFVNDSCLAFVSKSTAGTASIVNNKWLEFYDRGTAGHSSIINNNVLRFYDATAGDASITNNSEMAFRGESTAANSAIVNNGRIWISESSTGGRASINNATPDSIVILDRAGVTLGSITGPGEVDLNQAQLTVGDNDQSMTISGAIRGDWGIEREGSLVKVGGGTLTLTGTNSYGAMTVVHGGALAVNGFNARSRLTIVDGIAALTGNGTVGHTEVERLGTLAPGVADAPGSSIDIAGNLAFQPGAIYALRIDPSAATFAKVTGHATLDGATVNVLYGPGSYVERKYTILDTGGGVSGTFTPGVVGPPAGFKAELSYDDQHVYLSLVKR